MARLAGSQQNTGTLPGSGRTSSSTVFVFALAIAALYVGREIFVSVALAVLLSFMLAPLLTWMQRRRVPRVPAVVAVVTVAFAVVFVFAVVVVIV